MKNEVSLCMIVKNEEEYLPKCLSSIKDIIDEIIIVDTGSTDKTVEIAKTFGAKIYYFKWNNNFSEARNESLKYATKDWILILDADDELFEEDRKTFKALLNSKLDEKAIYYFETLSYYGSNIEKGDIAININPRLFKNNRGIHYKGEVHNQLVFYQGEYNAICDSIKIHHYGYLDKRITSKDKRNRNISILKEQIKVNPNDGFAYFNLGNEYASLDDMNAALEYYYKSYEDFDSGRGYSFILILRIIVSNYNLGNYDEALKFIDVGVQHYPKCTDLYYYQALIFKATDRPTLQIKALEKCIEIGEAPSELKFLYGTGSFRAYYELGNIYMKYKDYDTAYNLYIESMSSKPDYIEPLYNIANILKEQNVPIEKFKAIIEEFFSKNKESCYAIIADLFYHVEYYKTALEYMKKYEDTGTSAEDTIMLKLRCLIRNGDFEEYLSINEMDKKSSCYMFFSMYRVLSAILLKKYDYASSIVNNFKYDELSIYDKKLLDVYSELIKLFTKESTRILSQDKNNKEYMNIILEILEVLLINNKFDELKIAVNLLNLIDNKYALFYLGKLYFKNGYIDLAKKEILRSIKEFDVYDSESLDILKY
ncbi:MULTISPECIES: TPR domain-containing glycosyltransferase [unclassified Clostridium]|uniref:tetratricopeptide repeat-containing glycosyltransferase family 2 protein n=1 Tax=unclassified Clostridium TaxID=2614128 RepID=UPI0002983621|nr:MULTISPECIES: TPR domain-containing glycosyltransferase [unclassified Clostridium]EKQ57008.1 MAG: glycosyl transferase [Clostridium sp. Maddingley MBC34-26]